MWGQPTSQEIMVPHNLFFINTKEQITSEHIRNKYIWIFTRIFILWSVNVPAILCKSVGWKWILCLLKWELFGDNSSQPPSLLTWIIASLLFIPHVCLYLNTEELQGGLSFSVMMHSHLVKWVKAGYGHNYPSLTEPSLHRRWILHCYVRGHRICPSDWMYAITEGQMYTCNRTEWYNVVYRTSLHINNNSFQEGRKTYSSVENNTECIYSIKLLGIVGVWEYKSPFSVFAPPQQGSNCANKSITTIQQQKEIQWFNNWVDWSHSYPLISRIFYFKHR